MNGCLGVTDNDLISILSKQGGRAKPPEATRESLRKCGDFAPIRGIPFDPAPDFVVHSSHRNRSGR